MRNLIRDQIAISVVCLTLLARVANAQQLNIDWRYFGSSSAGGDDSVCFYDALSISNLPDKHQRVWTKCLPQKAVDAIDPKSNSGIQMVNAAVDNINHHYVPPFATIDHLSDDQTKLITIWEVIADDAEISPQAQIYYELDCSNLMLRTLSANLEIKGQSVSDDSPGTWDYVSPESDGGWLLSIVCPLH